VFVESIESIEFTLLNRNFSISSDDSLPLPFAVIALWGVVPSGTESRRGATWQSRYYNRARPGATSLAYIIIHIVVAELRQHNLSIACQVWARDCFALLAMTEPELIEKLC